MLNNMTLQQKMAVMTAIMVIFGLIVGFFGYTSVRQLLGLSVDEYERSIDYLENSPEKITPQTYGDLKMAFREKMKVFVSKSLMVLIMIMGIGVLMSVMISVLVLRTISTEIQSPGIGPQMSNNEIARTLESLAGIIRLRG